MATGLPPVDPIEVAAPTAENRSSDWGFKGGVDSVHRPSCVRHRGGIGLPRSDLLWVHVLLDYHAESDYQKNDSGYCQRG